MTKVAVASLGCAKNQVDLENMLGLIQGGGYELTDDEGAAEVIIVNTCCFINDAKQESIDTILDLARHKAEGSCRRLIVTGCMAQRYQEEILKELPEVDAIVGVGHIGDILSAMEPGGESMMVDRAYSHPLSERIRITPSYSAYLKIADGCDNRCTYCVIPSIRGGFNSRPVEELVREARSLAQSGVRELLLIAQDVTSYGIDLYGEARLVPLLKELCKIDGLRWIRLHYCYPERIDDALIGLIASEEKICNYLDMPIQHCNDELLRRMGRRSTREGLTGTLGRLREAVPGITLRTTLITGFPGETEAQYLEMMEFIKTQRFDRLGVFAYSREEGTPAAAMAGQVDEDVKEARREMLMLAQAEVSDERAGARVGKTLLVLVEGYDALVRRYFGRTEGDSAEIDGKVFFAAPRKLAPGEFVSVRIEEAMDYDLFGKAVI